MGDATRLESFATGETLDAAGGQALVRLTGLTCGVAGLAGFLDFLLMMDQPQVSVVRRTKRPRFTF
jgi:hypothetical protein